MKTFFKWLMKQDNRNDPVGDLASDIKHDPCLPTKKTKNTLLSYVATKSCYNKNVIDAFHEAWREYKNYRKII